MARSKDKHLNTTFPPGSTKLNFNPSPRLLRPSSEQHRGCGQHIVVPLLPVFPLMLPPAPAWALPTGWCSHQETTTCSGAVSSTTYLLHHGAPLPPWCCLCFFSLFFPLLLPHSSAFSALSYIWCHRGTGASVPLWNRLKLA